MLNHVSVKLLKQKCKNIQGSTVWTNIAPCMIKVNTEITVSTGLF